MEIRELERLLIKERERATNLDDNDDDTVMEFLKANIKHDFNDNPQGSECTPFYLLCREGSSEMVKFVMDNANVDINKPSGFAKKRPLLISMFNPDKEVAFLLLERKEIDLGIDEHGSNVIHYACGGNRIDVLKRFISDETFDINLVNKNGYAPVWNPVWRFYNDIVELMLDHPRLNPNVSDEFHYNPLALAHSIGNENAVRMLVKDRRTDVNMEFKDSSMKGIRLFYYFCDFKIPEAVSLMLEREDLEVNFKTPSNDTPIQKVVLSGNVEHVRLLLNSSHHFRNTKGSCL